MIWNICINICIWCNQNIISNYYFPYNSTIDSNPHLVANYWCSFSSASVFLTDCNTFVDIAIFSNNDLGVDCNAIWVSNIKTFAYFRILIKFNMISVSTYFE